MEGKEGKESWFVLLVASKIEILNSALGRLLGFCFLPKRVSNSVEEMVTCMERLISSILCSNNRWVVSVIG